MAVLPGWSARRLAPWGLVAVSLAVLIWSLAGEAERVLEAHYLLVDWRTYVAAFDRLMSHRSLYDPRQLAGPYDLPSVTLTGYAYPPVAAVLFAPFVSVPFGLVLWLSLNVALLFGGIAAQIHSSLGRFHPVAMSIVLLALSAFPPFLEGVAVGNINIGLAGLLAWAWVSGREAAWIGPVSGLAAAMKVFPGSLVVWAGVGHRARAVVLAGVVAGLLCVLTLPLVGGTTAWSEWLVSLGNAQPSCARWSNLYPSIPCVLSPLLGPEAAKLAGVGVGVALALLAWTCRRPQASIILLAGAWLAPVIDMDPYYLVIPFVVAVTLCLDWVGRMSGEDDPPVRLGGARSKSGVKPASFSGGSATAH